MPSFTQHTQQQQNATTYHNHQIGGVGKTTVFLSDGGYLDAGISSSQQPSSSRVYINSTPSSSTPSTNKTTSSPIQYPGHHRDKLDLIRDSLKPFEQCMGGVLCCNGAHNIASTSTNCFENDGTAGLEFSTATEPSDEIRRIMINALTQGGYDKESAYYALKLVNFNSVMDAAKVLSSIKQDLQNTHNPGHSQYLQQQAPPFVHTEQPANIYIGNYSDSLSLNPNLTNSTVINASALSSNGRAALSRYGVVSNHNLHPTSSTNLTVGNGSTVFGPKLYLNSQQPNHYQQQQYHQIQQPYLNVEKSLPITTTSSLNISIPANDFGGQMIFLPSTAEDSMYSNNSSSNKSESTSPIQGNLLVDLSSPSRPAVVRSPSPATRQQQQQKRRPRLGGGYQLSHTQHPHVVLRHSNSFDPVDQVEPLDTVRQSRQIQASSGTIIKIDRIASERIQPSALSLAPSFSSPLSSQISKRMDATTLNDSTYFDNNIVENTRQQMVQLQLGPSVSAPMLPSSNSGAKLTRTTTFSPQLQRHSHLHEQPPNNVHEQQQNYNLSNTRINTTVPNRLRSNTRPSEPFSTEPASVQSIFVDPDFSTLESSRKEITEPPGYGNYINQLTQHSIQGTVMNDSVIVSTTNRAEEKLKQPQSHVQRCVSPLPESVSRRLKTKSYERFVKPCRAAMFRFFMEQHIEKLIQQYRERNQRAIQLTKEMEAAELAETMKDQMLRLLRQKESKYIRLKRQKMNKNMFDMIRHIGVGAFGKKDTDQIYAMKTLSKEDVIQKQQAAHVKAERDILAEANSNWIVKLFFSFQDAQNLYFIMEYVPGGDMMQLLIHKGIFSERLARFYIAELSCAIEYVHSLGFIHRDIKPDNILIDRNGHIKLTDFGLCTGLRWTHDKRHYVIYDDDVPSLSGQHLREDSFSLPPHLANSKEKVKLLEYRHHKKRNQAHSVVGTGNYMAPEVIKKTGHTQLCDWWSVGVILYEMVYGRPPFMSHNENPCETQYMIVNWNRFLDLDNSMGARLSRNCVDIIARLCCDQEMRMGRGGAKEVKSHLWFKGIDFMNLRSTRAEYIPRVEHAEDTSNFDTFEVNGEDLFKSSHHSNGNSANHQQPYNPAFFDFTFRHFFASEGIHGAGVGGGVGLGNVGAGMRTQQQQRPSLAPLIEQANNNNANGDNKVNSGVISNVSNVDKEVKSNKTSITTMSTVNIKPLASFPKYTSHIVPKKKTPAPLAPNQNLDLLKEKISLKNTLPNNNKSGTVEYSDYDDEDRNNSNIPSYVV